MGNIAQRYNYLKKNIQNILQINIDNCTQEDNNSSFTTEVDISGVLDPFGDGSCVAYYPFSSDANDVSGVYNGIENNVTYKNIDGYDCVSFDVGYGSHIEIDNVLNIFETTNVAFSVNFYVNDTNTSKPIIASSYVEQKYGNRNILRTDNVYTYGGSYYSINSNIIPNKWTNMIVNIINDNAFFYLDGILIYTSNIVPLNDSGIRGYDYFAIGNDWYNITHNSFGTPNICIREMRFFNRPLTDIEIQNLYTNKMEVTI